MTENEQLRTVGQVADEVGVTVRTLHHYDHIGLVRPSERSWAGYRLYTDADLQRLQHVMLYRQLDFGLEEIADLLADTADVATHLRRQRPRSRTGSTSSPISSTSSIEHWRTPCRVSSTASAPAR